MALEGSPCARELMIAGKLVMMDVSVIYLIMRYAAWSAVAVDSKISYAYVLSEAICPFAQRGTTQSRYILHIEREGRPGVHIC